MISYDSVTEIPGNRAHVEQFDAMVTRYSWAAEQSVGKDVEEIACGSGVGLGMLSAKAASVVAGDCDSKILKHASDAAKNLGVRVLRLDAEALDLSDSSFDVAVCFEAIYYFSSLQTFLKETHRILRPDGRLVLCSVNPDWHGFNSSPFSNKYYSVDALKAELISSGFDPEVFMGFPDKPQSPALRGVGLLRQLAARFGLIPKSMKGKEFLKQLFYGKLREIPVRLTPDYGVNRDLIPVDNVEDQKAFKVIYMIGRKRPGSHS